MTPCLVSNKRPEAYPGPCQRSMELSLRENMECPNTGFFLVRIQENTNQKKIRTWTLSTQCKLELKTKESLKTTQS